MFFQEVLVRICVGIYHNAQYDTQLEDASEGKKNTASWIQNLRVFWHGFFHTILKFVPWKLGMFFHGIMGPS